MPTPDLLRALPTFDSEMQAYLETNGIPGASLAIVKDRKLIYAKGYGFADRDARVPVDPERLFRVASISKPVTAVAILQLVEQGLLGLDTPIAPLLSLAPPPGKVADDRLARVTIRHLLHHSGGWDRDAAGFDPMFQPGRIAANLGIPSPPGPEDIIRYMAGEPLDFEPGSRYAYSNLGYSLLGRAIERVTGKSYENYVQQQVLAPAGIRRMRIGASLVSAPDEANYYTPGDRTGDSAFSNTPRTVPQPYGMYNLEAMDSHGGWVASAVDLMRFAAALDDANDSPLLGSARVRELYAAPAAPLWRKASGELEDSFYAAGWLVRPLGITGKPNVWHGGLLPGTFTLMVRRGDGVDWAVLFNQQADDPVRRDSIDAALHRAAAAVGRWPDVDLFARFQ